MSRAIDPRRATIIGLWGSSVALVVVIETLQQLDVFHGRTATYILLAVTYGTAFSTLGGLILRRHPRHRVGWLFLAIGSAGAIELSISQIAHWIGSGAIAGTLAVGSEAVRLLNFGASGLLLLIYPTGHLLGRRWRWAAVALGFFGFGAISVFITSKGIPELAPLRGPIHIPAIQPLADALEAGSGVAMIGVLAGVVSLVVRFRRARSLERQQIKFFAFSAVACVLVIASATVAFPRQMETWFGDVVWNTPVVLLPAAAALAILRHGLYEIDRVVSRTVSYAIVSGVLVGTFALIVLLPTSLLGSGKTPGWLVAAGTLAALALLRPLRRRVQDAVDHRFNRARYDAERTIEAFAVRLREEIDIDALGAELRGVVTQTMQPSHVSLWLRSAD